MEYYAGLDVSLRLTAVCVMDERGKVVSEGKVASEPAAIAEFLQPYAARSRWPDSRLGLLAPYLYSGLAERGLPAVCIETRHMKAFAKASPVKTDRKDAHLIALAMKAGLYRAVHVKTDQSQRLRFLLTARELLLRQVRQLEETLRGSFKAFGLRMGNIAKRQFADRAGNWPDGQGLLAEVVRPLLAARKAMLEQLARLDRMVSGGAPRSGLPPADDGARRRHGGRAGLSYDHRSPAALSPVGHGGAASGSDAAQVSIRPDRSQRTHQ